MTLAELAGAALMEARGEKSRRRLARELNVSDRTLSDLETGRGNPTLERLERWGALYGVRFEIVAHPIDSNEQEAASG